MDSLSELIGLFNNADKQAFRQFLNKKNKREDVKNLKLFKLIETDDIISIKKHFNADTSADAYHALRKRLQDNVLLFLSQKNFESNNSETYDALRLLVVSRFLLENDVVKIAFKCLDKAERIAGHLEQFNLLNEVLLLKIQYAHLYGAEDLEALTSRFMQNQQAMQREAKLNMAYAYLRRELQEIHLKGKVVNLTAVLITTIRKYKIAMRELMTYRAIYQILYIANEYAAIQQNYGLIERYIRLTDQFIQRQTHNKQPYLFYHISILYFLANFHLRSRSFDASRPYLNRMKVLMDTDSRYYGVFYLRYTLLDGLNHFYTGNADEAVWVLRRSLSGIKQSSKREDIEDIRVCLAMFFALRNNKECLKTLSLLTRTDAWYEKQMGMLWTIRKNLMEILIHAQFSNIDVAMSRLNSFRRRYKKYLQKTAEERVLVFLNQVEKYLINPNVANDPPFKKAVSDLSHLPENNDLFSLSFIAWLMARWEKTSAYDVALELIAKS